MKKKSADGAPTPTLPGSQSQTLAMSKLHYANQIDEIRRLYASGEVEAALDLAGRVSSKSELPLSAVPHVSLPLTEILSLPLDHRAGFMLTRIDGLSNVQSIIDVSAMPEAEALTLMEKLVALGALTMVRSDPSDATLHDLTLNQQRLGEEITPHTPPA